MIIIMNHVDVDMMFHKYQRRQMSLYVTVHVHQIYIIIS